MSSFEIRTATTGDLEGIRALLEGVFREPFPAPYLRWLLEDPTREGALDALVATAEGRVVGQVGAVRAGYRVGDATLTGAHAIALAVAPGFRGGLGTELLRWASTLGDVSILLEGTEAGVRVYPKVGLRRFGHVDFFRTTLRLPRPGELIRAGSKRAIARAAGRSLWERAARLRVPARVSEEVRIEPLDLDADLAPLAPPLDARLQNEPTAATLRWFRRCPGLESEVHGVTRRGAFLGVLLLYVKRGPRGAAGRVVHLPNLGAEAAAWARVIGFAEGRLRALGCGSASVAATHPDLVAALRQRGYRRQRRQAVWLLDPDGRIPRPDWHLTCLEGDHAFRGIG